MSGIFGSIGKVENSDKVLKTMSQAIAHRGPDGEVIINKSGTAFGCRLLKTSVSGTEYPFVYHENTIWVVLDGALYNFEELNRILSSSGQQRCQRNDSEMIACLYQNYGPSFIEKLRGMFAFALWDDRRGQLMLARDHIGQKPIFYAHVNGTFYFASEVKAINTALLRTPTIDLESLYHYLSLRFVPAPHTMIEDIKKLLPSSYLILHEGKVQIKRYWRPSFRIKTILSEESYIEGLCDKFQETVGSHMVGDLPIGAFLSGGLDSSLIVSMMANVLKKPFKTFSVGVSDKEFDELPYARIVSNAFGTSQHETIAEENLFRTLPSIIRYLDEPSDPVAASKFIGSRLASEHVKIVMGGDGGDELFAGFDRYIGVRFIGYYASLPAFIRNKIIGALIDFIPASFGYESISQKLRWISCVAEASEVSDRFSEAVSFFRFNYFRKKALFGHGIWQQLKNFDSRRIISDKFSECDSDEIIEKMLYSDYLTRLPEHSLMLTDRLSMAHGLEVRSPLVDKELVELVSRFPLNLKIRGRQSKYAERKLGERILPIEISKRKKTGFRFPLAFWFGNQLFSFLKSIFQDSHLVSKGIFRHEYIGRLLEEHRKRIIDHNVRIWMLLNLEIWFRLVIEHKKVEELEELIGNLIDYRK